MSAYGSRLSGITKELWVQWQQTKESWRDEKSRQFEQKYLSELVAAVDKSVTVIEQLDKLIEKIKKDCD